MDASTTASKKETAAIRLKWRKTGRPSRKLQLDRRHYARKIFKERYGIDIIALMLKKGYYMTKYDAKLAKKQGKFVKAPVEETPVVEGQEAPVEAVKVVEKDEFADKPADKVVKAMINAILRGEKVPGFTLVPENKVVGNKTIEAVIIPSFARGNPAYGMSLVSLREEYAS